LHHIFIKNYKIYKIFTAKLKIHDITGIMNFLGFIFLKLKLPADFFSKR